MVLLGQWAAILVRKHTTPVGATVEIAFGYNSSASVVNALFMMFNVFGINVLRAARPAFSIPTIGYTVYVLVGFVYGPQEPTESSSIRFSKELLYSFLTGQAIAMGVSLFVIPVSSRNVFFAEATGFLQSTQGSLKAQSAFVEALEYTGMCEPFGERKVLNDETEARQSHNHAEAAKGRVLYNERASTLKSATVNLLSLGGKLRDDVVFAKREISYSYLRANDIHEMHQLLRNISKCPSNLYFVYTSLRVLRNYI
jgi:Putative ER transporter, 6TM, N-terminal